MRLTHAWNAWLLAVLVAAVWMTGCSPQDYPLTQIIKARAVTADVRVHFARASDRTSLVVIAGTDEASAQAAQEARDARALVESNAAALGPLLTSLGYSGEQRLFKTFETSFAEYKTLDDSILDLAVENSNVKAERLLAGPVRKSAETLRGALEAAVTHAPPNRRERAQMIAARAEAALFEWQVFQGRHIAEADEEPMTTMERRMNELDAGLRDSIASLRSILPPASRPSLDSAGQVVSELQNAHAELIRLSRLNTNVRSLALMLGRRRVVAAACDDTLTALSEALQQHTFPGTR